jgi:RNA polymerase sigma-70 factor (ECF subfamily)
MSMSQSSCGSTSSSLLRRARQKDADAWKRLTDIYGPLVYRWARRGGLQPNDAADVSQEVFRVVATRISQFRSDRPGDSFRGWLWGITKNKLKERFRQQTIGGDGAGGTASLKRLQEFTASLPSDSSEFESVSSRRALLQRAMKVVQQEFEDGTWQAFWRSAVEEHKTADIAEEMGMTTAAVRQAKYRVLRRLRQELL